MKGIDLTWLGGLVSGWYCEFQPHDCTHKLSHSAWQEELTVRAAFSWLFVQLHMELLGFHNNKVCSSKLDLHENYSKHSWHLFCHTRRHFCISWLLRGPKWVFLALTREMLHLFAAWGGNCTFLASKGTPKACVLSLRRALTHLLATKRTIYYIFWLQGGH